MNKRKIRQILSIMIVAAILAALVDAMLKPGLTKAVKSKLRA